MTAPAPSPRPVSGRRRSHTMQFAALGVGLVAALLVVLLVTRKPAEDRQSISPVVGHRAPALNGKVIQGSAVDVGANDRWLLVNFFATWCTPCVEEHPQLRAFSEEHKQDGRARVVSVVYGDKPAAVRRFFADRKGDWTVLDSNEGRTALDWGVAKVPESFLVSPTGIVVQRFATGSGVTQSQLDNLISQYERQGGSSGADDGGGSPGTGPGSSVPPVGGS